METTAPICIVCLRNDGGADSREHVLQDGLGARFLLPQGVLCDRCNKVTSVLDKALLDFVAASREQKNDRPILSGSTAICSLDGRWWRTHVNLRNWNRALPPQLLVLADGTVKGWGANPNEIQCMRTELQPANAPQVRCSELRPFQTELKGQSLVVRSKRGVYQILAANEAEQSKVEEIIASGQLATADWDVSSGLDAILKNAETPVLVALPVYIDHAHRALYKVLLSFIAYTLGPEMARLRVFDAFRRAVLDGRIEKTDVFELGVEQIQRIAQDAERFGFSREATVFLALFGLNRPAQAQAAAEKVLQFGKHALIIGCAYGQINALVALYGKPHANLRYPVPRLDWFPSGIWACAIIDPEDGASCNDSVACPPPKEMEHVSRYLHEVSSKYEELRPEVGFEFRPSKPRVINAQFTYAPHVKAAG